MAEAPAKPHVEAPLTVSDLMAFFAKMNEQNSAQTKAMIETIVAEIRKPPVDPIKEVQKARMEKAKNEANDSYWKSKAAKKKNCAHMRQNGTTNIAWATQSDGVERGFCPYCQSEFGPEDGELYQKLRRIPRGMIESVRYV